MEMWLAGGQNIIDVEEYDQKLVFAFQRLKQAEGFKLDWPPPRVAAIVGIFLRKTRHPLNAWTKYDMRPAARRIKKHVDAFSGKGGGEGWGVWGTQESLVWRVIFVGLAQVLGSPRP